MDNNFTIFDLWGDEVASYPTREEAEEALWELVDNDEDEFYEYLILDEEERYLQEQQNVPSSVRFIIVDECGDEVEFGTQVIMSGIDRTMYDLYIAQKCDEIKRLYPEARRVYAEDASLTQKIVAQMMREWF